MLEVRRRHGEGSHDEDERDSSETMKADLKAGAERADNAPKMTATGPDFELRIKPMMEKAAIPNPITKKIDYDANG